MANARASRSISRRSSVFQTPVRLRRGPPVAANDPFANCDWSYVFIESSLDRSDDDEFSFFFTQFSDLASRSHYIRDRERIRLVNGRSLHFVRDAEGSELGPDSHAIMVPDAAPGSELSPISIRICSGGDSSQYESPSLYNFVPRFSTGVNQNVQRKTCWQFTLKFNIENVDPGMQIVPATRKFTKSTPVNETTAWMDSVQVHIKHDGGDFAIAEAFQFVSSKDGLNKISGYQFVQPHLFSIRRVSKADDVWDAERSILKSVYTVHIRPCLAPAPIVPGIRAQYIDPNGTAALQEWQIGQNRTQVRRMIDSQAAQGVQPDGQLTRVLEALDTLVTPEGNMRRAAAPSISQPGQVHNEATGQSSHLGGPYGLFNPNQASHTSSSGQENPGFVSHIMIPSVEAVQAAGCLDPSLLSQPPLAESIDGGLQVPQPDSFDWEGLINWDTTVDDIDWDMPLDPTSTDLTMSGAATNNILEPFVPQLLSAQEQQQHDFFREANAAAEVPTTEANRDLLWGPRSSSDEPFQTYQQEELPGFAGMLNDEQMDYTMGGTMEWEAQTAPSPAHRYPDPETPSHNVFSPYYTPETALTLMPIVHGVKREADTESPSERLGKNKRAKTAAAQTAGGEAATKPAEATQLLAPTVAGQRSPRRAPTAATPTKRRAKPTPSTPVKRRATPVHCTPANNTVAPTSSTPVNQMAAPTEVISTNQTAALTSVEQLEPAVTATVAAPRSSTSSSLSSLSSLASSIIFVAPTQADVPPPPPPSVSTHPMVTRSRLGTNKPRNGALNRQRWDL